jgi:hypothetical protein
VTALRLPAGDYALFGSTPMLAHGLIQKVHDIDIVARGGAWRRAAALGEIRFGSHHDRLVTLPGEIEVFDGWLGADPGPLIEGAERLHGLPFVQLEAVLSFKLALQRPKDARHIALLRRHLARRSRQGDV